MIAQVIQPEAGPGCCQKASRIALAQQQISDAQRWQTAGNGPALSPRTPGDTSIFWPKLDELMVCWGKMIIMKHEKKLDTDGRDKRHNWWFPSCECVCNAMLSGLAACSPYCQRQFLYAHTMNVARVCSSWLSKKRTIWEQRGSIISIIKPWE